MKKDLSTKTVIIIIAAMVIVAGIILTIFVGMNSDSITFNGSGFEEVSADQEDGGSTGQVSLQIIEPPENVE
ncbi:hypothetical protein HN652_01040 [archaeon]|jgi:hypothetical protein|nr:hypothetical protein [archaeon]MBT6868923.1 hypothetical protein [archaeon]MBT7192856.1 hypothetical protein [archaeon]MBT7380822.1 hypothetical protein [archaeon]MBT7507577.1 hypothetical protein [archaeon]